MIYQEKLAAEHFQQIRPGIEPFCMSLALILMWLPAHIQVNELSVWSDTEIMQGAQTQHRLTYLFVQFDKHNEFVEHQTEAIRDANGAGRRR